MSFAYASSSGFEDGLAAKGRGLSGFSEAEVGSTEVGDDVVGGTERFLV